MCVLFVAALNLNPAFAAAAAQVPVIGSMARVLTFTEYHIESDSQLLNAVCRRSTGPISRISRSASTRRSSRRSTRGWHRPQERAAQEYDAYVATGGNPDEFIPVTIAFDYEVKSCTDDILSFELQRFEVRASSFTELTYYNIDLNTGESITLEDLLGRIGRTK